ncbi:hypothetical protein EVAR_55237_1 [Eumeta japonica]|uniref:Uncharacterized protein n=1 Tax=Eumeta variegata TaxID=151549 RepID=A0A4C1Y7K5_EUMVA|nr:hypothetical protein EVAR_55237_1 [Eumeta japonica]
MERNIGRYAKVVFMYDIKPVRPRKAAVTTAHARMSRRPPTDLRLRNRPSDNTYSPQTEPEPVSNIQMSGTPDGVQTVTQQTIKRHATVTPTLEDLYLRDSWADCTFGNRTKLN